jgi:integrase
VRSGKGLQRCGKTKAWSSLPRSVHQWNPRNLNRHFANLRATAGLPSARLHDMRHTVVSMLMELGVPPHVVQAIARHADVKLTLNVHSHMNLDAMRQALGNLDGRQS